MKMLFCSAVLLAFWTPVLPAQTNDTFGAAPRAVETAPSDAGESVERHRARRDADDRYDGSIELQGSYGWALNGDYLAIGRIGLNFSFIETERDWGGLTLGSGRVELRDKTFAQDVVHDPLVLETGLFYRHYFTDAHVFLKPYAGLSLSGLVLIWDYRFPVDTGDRVLHMDYMYGADVGANIGLAVQVSRRCNVYGEAIVGGVLLPEDTTRRGVYNNFLESFGYAGVRIGMLCKV